MEKLEAQFDFKTADAVRNMQALLEALEQVERRLGRLSEQVTSGERSMQSLATGSSTTARTLSEVGESAQRAGHQVEEAGKKATVGFHEGTSAAKQLDSAMTQVVASAGSLIGTFAGMQSVMFIVREMQERMQATLQARQAIAQIDLGRDRSLQPLMNNIDPNFASGADQTVVKGIVDQFRKNTGATDEQAVNILSQAQSTGIRVFNPQTGKVNAGGMEIASLVGQFAAWSGLDADSAGKLFVIAKTMGVKDVAGMKRLLTTFDVASQNAPVANPRDFTNAAIKAAALRMAQGVPLDQSLAQLAAAATVSHDPLVAATMVEQFSRVAGGDTPEQSTALAKMARARGVLTDSMVAPFRESEMQAAMGDKADELARIDREMSELRGDEAGKQKAEDASIARASGPDRAAKRREVAIARRERQDRLADLQSRRDAIMREVTGKAEDAALADAYRTKLDRSQQESFLLDTLRTMSPEERRGFIRKIAPGKIADDIIAQTAPGSLEAFDAVMGAAGSTSTAALDRKLAAYSATNTVAAAGLAQAQMDREASEEATALQEADALQRIGANRAASKLARGKATTGILASGLNSTDTPNIARNQDFLEAQQTVEATLERAWALWGSMTPEQQAANPELKAFLDKYKHQAGTDVTGLFTMPAGGVADVRNSWTGTGAKKKASDIALEFGRIHTSVNHGSPPAAPPEPHTDPPTTAPAHHAGPISYNHTVHIGNVFTRELSDDLPGRLGGGLA